MRNKPWTVTGQETLPRTYIGDMCTTWGGGTAMKRSTVQIVTAIGGHAALH